MLNNIVIGKYYKTKSDIHTLSSVSKIISLFLLLISILITNDIIIIIPLISFELIMVLLTNVPFKIYLKNIFSLKYLIVFIFIINYINHVNIVITLITLLKIVGIVLYSSLFTLTTTPTDINKGLSYLFKPLNKIGIKTSKLTFSISLTLRFIPTIIEQANKILKSLASRGLDYSDSKVKDKMFIIKSMTLPMFILSFKRADKVAEALELKLYSLDGKNNYKFKWQYLDVLFIIIHVIILLLIEKEVVL